jgi:riboflavin synthase
VNAVNGAQFDLNIIPQTVAETIFGQYQPGTLVNLEVDVIARYLERLVLGDAAADPGEPVLSMETLAENGFLR